MKTLDRYIIGQFLINFVILMFVVLALFVLVDLIVNLDEFVQAGRYRAERFGGFTQAFVWTLGDYYGPLLVLLFVYFAGLVVAGATGFTLAGLSRQGETVAMIASGISLYRVAAPIVVAGCLIGALTIPCQELIIPEYAQKLARSKSQVRYDAIGGFEVAYAADGASNLLSAGKFEPQHNLLTDVTILERDEHGRAIRRVVASQARWSEQPRGWELTNGFAIHRQPTDVLADDSDIDLQEVTFFPSDLAPQVLLARRASIYPRLLSVAELRQLMGSRGVDVGELQQIIHTRFSLLVVNMLVLVMALPFFLVREPANQLGQAVKAAGVCMVAWAVGLGMLQIGAEQLSPVAAAWLPVVLYLPLSALLLQAVKT